MPKVQFYKYCLIVKKYKTVIKRDLIVDSEADHTMSINLDTDVKEKAIEELKAVIKDLESKTS